MNANQEIQKEPFISIIVPVYNERENIDEFGERLYLALRNSGFRSEVIFVDDHSSDGTWEYLLELERSTKETDVFRVLRKHGRRGKAFSLLQGFAEARGNILAMIDGDLQYAPEEIPPMVEKLVSHDIIVANRNARHGPRFRRMASRAFTFVLGRILLGISADMQSGLKVFRREVLHNLRLAPTTWGFDYVFLYKAKRMGWRIGEMETSLSNRPLSKSGINARAAFEDMEEKWRFQFRYLVRSLHKFIDRPHRLETRSYTNTNIFTQSNPLKNKEMLGASVYHRSNHYITHTTLLNHHTALYTVTVMQKTFFLLFLLGGMLAVIAAGWHTALIIIITFLTFIYFVDLLFNFFLIFRSFHKSPDIIISKESISKIPDSEWPTYTIFCPLYKEWDVLPQFIKAISSLDYPKEKMEVLLLLEEDDLKTIEALKPLNIPTYFHTIIVPHSLPKTKPKALNYGLAHANGDYAVIYDAEDIPDLDQLKKAVLAFKKSDNKIICMQAKLNFYNPKQNILTKLFTAEYSLWFDLILTGLQSINAPIPLGGTSNHFRTADLRLLQGWDPFNVTEDCDLGMRLHKRGYHTAIFDSTTLEESNSNLRNWLRQRSRWIKGYLQTYCVHIRRSGEYMSDWKDPHIITFQLIIGGKVTSMFINPIMWTITISYFIFRPIIGSTIESLFLPPIFYIALFSLIIGNFFYLYYYMIGCIKRKHWDIVPYAFLVPIYWLMMSIAAWIAIYQLIFKPHYWEKTHHGLHLKKREGVVGAEIVASD